MGSVYATAHHTIIFLGPGTSNSDMLLHQFHFSWSRRKHYALFSDGEWKAMLEDVLLRSWFGRVWILQELVLSTNPWIQCGYLRVKWALMRSLFAAEGSEVFRRICPEATKSFLDMDVIRKTYMASSQSHGSHPPEILLLDILVKRRGFGASDTRDLIYAHLGMTHTAFSTAIEVDYGKNCCDVYTEVAQRLLLAIPGLDIISLATSSGRTSRLKGLPSWVPDWSLPQSSAPKITPFRLKDHDSTCTKWPVTGHHLLHDSSSLLLLNYLRHSTVDTVINYASSGEMPQIVTSNQAKKVRFIDNIWEIEDDSEHRQTMLLVLRYMLATKLSSEEIEDLMHHGLPSSNVTILQYIVTSIQSGELWSCKRTIAHLHKSQTVIIDTLMMLLFIARLYLEGAKVAIMTDGSAMVVPSCVEKGDHCILFPQRKYTRSESSKGVTNINMLSWHSTFVREDKDFEVTAPDISYIRDLDKDRHNPDYGSLSSSVPFKILETGQYPYTFTLSELQDVDRMFALGSGIEVTGAVLIS